MKNIIAIIAFCFLILCSCSEKEQQIKKLNYDENLTYKYKTEVYIYYTAYYKQKYVVYSNKEIYTCSFQGTNFILEKDNTEEIFSTTAPIQILNTEENE